MAAVNVTFPGNLAQVETANDLRRIPTSLIHAGTLYLVGGLEGVFSFDPGSSAADDGATVIRPSDRTPMQVGRWIKKANGMASGPAGPTGASNSTYANLAALKAADPTNLSFILTTATGPITYAYVAGNFTGKADDVNVVALDGVPVATGALVRQSAGAVNFDGRSTDTKLRELPSVKDARFAGGARGDGINDDAPAWQACANAHKKFEVPPGQYRFGSTVRLNDYQMIVAAGESPWEPYTGGEFPAGFRSEVLVDGILAFNARGTNAVTVDGLGLRAKTGKQSAYGQPAGFQPGSASFAITGNKQFVATNISASGLHKVVQSHTSGDPEVAAPGGASGVETTEEFNSANPTQMPRFSNFTFADCERVWAFGTPASTLYTVRDPRISGVVVGLHCGQIVEAHKCDGFRYEVNRNFQCTGSSLYLRAVPYPQLSGVCLFETGDDALVLQDCLYAKVDALIGRAGDYLMPTQQRSAFRATGCDGLNAVLMVERPTGRAVTLDDCAASVVNVTVFQPFYKTGNMSNLDGVVRVTNSRSTVVNLAVNGENDTVAHTVDLWADWASEQTLTGSVSGVLGTGTVRAKNVSQRGLIHITLPAAIVLNAGGVSDPIARVRTFIPAGRKLKARSVSQTSPTVQLRTVVGGDAAIWLTTAEPDGGTISLDDKTLYDNTAGSAGYYYVEFTLRNPPDGSTVTVPAGHDVRISTAIV